MRAFDFGLFVCYYYNFTRTSHFQLSVAKSKMGYILIKCLLVILVYSKTSHIYHSYVRPPHYNNLIFVDWFSMFPVHVTWWLNNLIIWTGLFDSKGSLNISVSYGTCIKYIQCGITVLLAANIWTFHLNVFVCFIDTSCHRLTAVSE